MPGYCSVPAASFVDRVAAASSAGFDAISLFPQQTLDCRNKEKRSVADMRAILDDHAISVDEIDPLLDWYGPGASRSEQLMYRIADELGARSINAAPAFASDRTPAEVADIFARLCQRASQKQLRVLVSNSKNPPSRRQLYDERCDP